MAKEIRVPALGESVTEATIAKWFKNVGDAVKADEPMVELETDKVTVEVPAPASGKLSSIAAAAGTTVNVGALLGAIEEGAAGAAAKPAAAAPAAARLQQKSPNLQKPKPRSLPPCARSSPKTSLTLPPFPPRGGMAVLPRVMSSSNWPSPLPRRSACLPQLLRHRAAKSA